MHAHVKTCQTNKGEGLYSVKREMQIKIKVEKATDDEKMLQKCQKELFSNPAKPELLLSLLKTISLSRSDLNFHDATGDGTSAFTLVQCFRNTLYNLRKVVHHSACIV